MPLVREIEYQGYVFRSKAEAKWAFFLDALEIEYFYEPDTFTLTTAAGKGVNYLPDFLLSEQNVFVEVKLEPKPKPEECWKCWALAVETGMDVLLLFEPIGKIDYNGFRYKGGTGEVEPLQRLTTCPFCNTFGFTKLGLVGDLPCECSNRCADLANDRASRIKTAIDKTRKERFGA